MRVEGRGLRVPETWCCAFESRRACCCCCPPCAPPCIASPRPCPDASRCPCSPPESRRSSFELDSRRACCPPSFELDSRRPACCCSFESRDSRRPCPCCCCCAPPPFSDSALPGWGPDAPEAELRRPCCCCCCCCWRSCRCCSRCCSSCFTAFGFKAGLGTL